MKVNRKKNFFLALKCSNGREKKSFFLSSSSNITQQRKLRGERQWSISCHNVINDVQKSHHEGSWIWNSYHLIFFFVLQQHNAIQIQGNFPIFPIFNNKFLDRKWVNKLFINWEKTQFEMFEKNSRENSKWKRKGKFFNFIS